jgi:hypothetical protein
MEIAEEESVEIDRDTILTEESRPGGRITAGVVIGICELRNSIPEDQIDAHALAWHILARTHCVRSYNFLRPNDSNDMLDVGIRFSLF